MKRHNFFAYALLGFLIGFGIQELVRPSTAAGDFGDYRIENPRAQDVLLDYEEQRARFGTTGPGAEAILDAQIAVQGETVFVVQNGQVLRSTSNGEAGTWEIVLR